MRVYPDSTTSPLTLEAPVQQQQQQQQHHQQQHHQPSSFISLVHQPTSQPVNPYSTDFYHHNAGHISYNSLGPRLGSRWVDMPATPAPTVSASSRSSSSYTTLADRDQYFGNSQQQQYTYTRSSNTSASGHMAHGHRSTTLPQPGSQLGATRDLYSTATPSYRRIPDHHHTLPLHAPRSPSYPGLSRRHPLSPTPSPHVPFAPLRMDPGYGQKAQANLPPLNPQTTLGVLSAPDGSPIKFDINGSIDKGFFLSDNDWTCYRRNYFSCICSFSLNPDYHTQGMQFTVGSGQSGQTFPVHGFAMSISAMVADSDTHSIDLVQHTPKRDKGPIAKPDKVRLNPKPAQAPGAYGQLGMYGQPDTGLPSSRPYDQGGFGQGQTALPTEHTFERIQFKQATANNGKRRAAQQYYHLIIELYADVGDQSGQTWVKMGHRKSAKMIVRGRSPGHYQSERRGSSGSGPSNGSGLGDGSYGGGMMGGHFGGGATLMNTYPGGGFDPRHGYSGARHHQQHQDMPIEPILSPVEDKNIHEHKGYQYYPTPIYESDQDGRNPVEMFHHSSKMETDSTPQQQPQHSHLATNNQLDKVKGESYDSSISSVWYPGTSYYGSQRCGRFEGKSTSAGYYPSMLPPTAAMNI